MATAYTSLLGLALPVTGELSGNWGDVVNDSITSLLDSAISGTTTLSTDADVTLTTTTGAANEARQAIILWNPASGTVTRNITAPAQSKIYTVINASGGTQSIVFRGAGPTTGVTIVKGESAVVAWNGTDFIKISNAGGAASFTNVTVSGTTTLSGLTASTALALDASKNVVSVTNTGTGSNVLATSPTLVTPVLGTPTSVTLTNATGLPVATGISGLGSGVATFLATPSSANLASAVTDKTGSGALVFANSPTLVTPALGTPASGVVTNLTGTASININGTVGATTASTGAFTTLTTSSTVTLNGGTANGVAFLDASKVLTTGSALTFDGTSLAVGNTTGTAGIPLTLNAASGNNTNLAFQENQVDKWYLRNITGNGGFSFYDVNAGSEQMRLTSTGLGIGTSSPSAKIHAFRSSGSSDGGATNSMLFLESGGSNANLIKFNGVAATEIAFGRATGSDSFYWGAIAGPTEWMRLTSTGLGIGTSSPGARLHSVSTSAGLIATQLLLSNADGTDGTGAQITFSAVSGGTTPTGSLTNVRDASGSYSLRFATFGGGNNTERMRLDSSGNLGLGVTPSAWASGTKAFDVGSGSALFNPGSTTLTWLMSNSYNNGTNFIYKNTGAAGYYSVGTAHSWHTAPSGTAGNAISFTQAMTLDASGNLAIGRTAATTRLHLKAASDGADVLQIQNSSETQQLYLGVSADGPYVFAAQSTNLRFGTGNTERARIDSSGNLLVGATTNINIAGVNSSNVFVAATNNRWAMGVRNTTASTPWGIAVEYSAAAPNDASSNFLYCYDSTATLRMSVRSNGGIANFQANDANLSDRREKTNFAPAKSYLDVICAIPVQTFNYIDQNLEEDPGLTLGVVAQDVQAVAPELVMESNWGTKDDPKMRLSIYQTDLQYALMKALQELKAEFDAYKASHP
jgi:hypothetical protein